MRTNPFDQAITEAIQSKEYIIEGILTEENVKDLKKLVDKNRHVETPSVRRVIKDINGAIGKMSPTERKKVRKDLAQTIKTTRNEPDSLTTKEMLISAMGPIFAIVRTTTVGLVSGFTPLAFFIIGISVLALLVKFAIPYFGLAKSVVDAGSAVKGVKATAALTA